jgi:chaperone required for assembly of F1-ATPase
MQNDEKTMRNDRKRQPLRRNSDPAGEPTSNPDIDPIVVARRGVRPVPRRRFFQTVSVAPDAEGFRICLDGKPVRTPARRTLTAPTPELAEALAKEWRAQQEFIDPAQMPLTRLANAIIDRVAANPGPVADDIKKYLGSDLLYYRAGAPERLRARQAQHWDPILAWARDKLGAEFKIGEGIVHVAQPEAAIEAAASAIPEDPWRLGALHAATTLSGSALIALALLRGRLSAGAAWQAAHVDEDWNMELWGRDEIALAQRAFRFAEFQAAATVLGAIAE